MKNKGTLIILLISAIVGGLLALGYYLVSSPNKVAKGMKATTVQKPSLDKKALETAQKPSPLPKEESLEQKLARYGISQANHSPLEMAKVMEQLAKSGNMEILDLMVHQSLIPAQEAQALKDSLLKSAGKIDQTTTVTEVGEIERGKKVRWAINKIDGSRILIDMAKNDEGNWSISRVLLPTEQQNNAALSADESDALSVIDAFVHATMSQQFSIARQYVNTETVDDATIAGVCILFEEGEYVLRKNASPIRHMFGKDKKRGYLAYLQSSQPGRTGNIGFTMEQQKQGKWQIEDLSLDNLLQDYSNRYDCGGMYIPLVKNPQGGDSIVLYFGFDEAILTPRSMRQLEIVAQMIKVDDAKKIEITGHTDDLGTDAYNQSLSEQRANAVSQALIGFGLKPEQVVTKGFGKKRQRYNIADPKSKNADAIRQANRRAEIYLDF